MNPINHRTNELSQSIIDARLKEQYGITEEELIEADTQELLEKQKHEALKRVAQGTLRSKNSTVNLVSNEITRPIELEGDLPGAHQRAIEYNTENTLPHTDPKEEIHSNSLETTPDKDENAPLITDAFLKEKYKITEEYLRDYPEGYQVLQMVRDLEEDAVFNKKLIRAADEGTKNLDKLIEDARTMKADRRELLELQREERRALERISERASNIRAMLSEMATMFSMCTNRVRNLWTSPRPVIGELAQANPSAIEYNVEHIIPKGDPTDNAPSIDGEKKNRACLIKFFVNVVGVVGLYVLYLKGREMFRSSSGGK